MTASHLVSASQIQKELDFLWDSLENKNKMRASLFNLIFYTKKTARDEYIRKITQKLIERFPARIFVISSDEDSKEDYLKIAVSVMSAEQGEFDVTCDLIEISVSGKGEEQVPFIILPHIIPDLPVFLLWAEDPSKETTIRKELQKFATRLIFDSETAENLSHFASSILKIKEQSHCEIADLNWARVESWRDLLNATFYDSESVDKLKNAESIHITFNAQESAFFCHTKIQSIYLQAWLATRLRWSHQKVTSTNGEISITYQTEKGLATIFLKPVRHPTLPPGIILSFEMTTFQKEYFHFERSLESIQQITLEFSNAKACIFPKKFLFAKGESGQSLIKEICHKGTSDHYLGVLNLIETLNANGLC